MRNSKVIFSLGLSVSIVISLLAIHGLAAASKLASPPSTLHVSMHVLAPPVVGGVSVEVNGTPATCNTPDNQDDWGCTAFFHYDNGTPDRATVVSYPYGSTVEPDVSLEEDYLKNVLPAEISIAGVPTSAIAAQAIVARSYGWRKDLNGILDNSISSQRFVPYYFEYFRVQQGDNAHNPASTPTADLNNCAAITPTYQSTVCNVLDLTTGKYLTAHDNETPAFAEYSADAYLETNSGSESYLQSVADPISADEDVQTPAAQSHGRGMSQNGAVRWSKGVMQLHETPTPWSVTWAHPEEILTHYYTGVDLRDSGGNSLLPDLRWNLLKQNDQVINADPGDVIDVVNITVQNTGITSWTTGWIDNNQAAIFYQFCSAPCTAPDPDNWQEGAELPVLAPGESAVAEAWVWPDATPGSRIMLWDICRRAIWRAEGSMKKPQRPGAIEGQTTWCFNDVSDPGWYPQPVEVSNTPTP